MADKEFNLLDEPWIVAMRLNGETEEVSLPTLFKHAPEYRRLAGELPTQDVAILRLLLAVLHAVFARYDLAGNYAPLFQDNGYNPKPEDAFQRWKALWDRKAFPMDIIRDYLEVYRERFYLFHPQRPFYQVPEMKIGTEYTAAKLNGELSESSNKVRLFPQRTRLAKHTLACAEAARWLLYINAYDDTSAKPKVKGLPSPGAGWLGQLGLTQAVGNTLFETLLLNLVLLNKDGTELWGEECPAWETDVVKSGERTPIPVPGNPSELLTLQSRRLLLKRKENSVIGYLLLGGDHFPKEAAQNEQMTVWRNVAKKKEDTPEFQPKRHDPSRQLWRDFASLAAQSEGYRRPGVVGWVAKLAARELIPSSVICFQVAAVKYGDKDFFVEDVFADSLSFHSGFLRDLDGKWIGRILEGIEVANQLAGELGRLAQNIAKAAGNADGNNQRKEARQQAYFNMDTPFRQWLGSIVPNISDVSWSEESDKWWNTARRIVRQLGEELVSKAGAKAFIGKVVVENKKPYRYTAPEAYNWFLYNTSSREALKRGKKNG